MILDKSISDLTVQDMKEWLKSMSMTHSYRSRQQYIDQFTKLQKYYNFPWRDDQRQVLEEFLNTERQYYTIQGLAGCGKTTLLIGMLLNACWQKRYQPEEIMFISFNVSIRNEIRQKLRLYGLKSRVTVRTFDSLIWEICKKNDYRYIDLPNFDGKRRFVYDLIQQQTHTQLKQPRCIFVDEVQDLEQQTWKFFRYYYPNSTVILAGDVFQSIQKEPRESLLWYLLHDTPSDVNIKKMFMYQTPRVPQPVLEEVRGTLKGYYPEFTSEIDRWESLNPTQTTIEWASFNTYKDLFQKADDHIKEFGPTNTMLLTFSSAITVKGAMGDVSRFRTDLMMKGYKLNKNYKLMNPDKLFLSTVNSSKGLERDYVIVFLTFPLERAFINFSQDLTMNLITVGITRAKKKIIFYVPAYKDKFSQCLDYYKECPQPTKEKIRDGKILQEYTWTDYINIEHCVTELLRQNIILYDTRLKIKEYCKAYDWGKPLPENIKVPSTTECEENKSFIGILVENLITSSWLGRWPKLPDLDMISRNPMYVHCMGRIYKYYEKYLKFIQSRKFKDSNQYEGIYIYTQVHVAIFNKLFMNLPNKEEFGQWWKQYHSVLNKLKPTGKIKIQENVKMPWVTGVVDCFIPGDTENPRELWELKASKDPNWKDDALSQVLIYALCMGKSRCRINLLNPFRNEKVSMYFKTEQILTLRHMLYSDIISWNFNCWLAKNNKGRRPSIKLSNKTIHSSTPTQSTIIQFLSPTKIHIKENLWQPTVDTESTDWVDRISMEHKDKFEVSTNFDHDLGYIRDQLGPEANPLVDLEYSRSETKTTPNQEHESKKLRTHGINWNENIAQMIGYITLLVQSYKIV